MRVRQRSPFNRFPNPASDGFVLRGGLSGSEREELVTGAFPHGHSGTAAKNILLRAARARHADSANNGDSVEDRYRAAHGHHPSAMGNH